MMGLLWIALALANPEIPYDGLDQDGDGLDWADVDGDSVPSVLAGGEDCNDRDLRVHPDAWDWRGDGIDRDCDGLDGMVEGPVGRGVKVLMGVTARYGEALGAFSVLGLLAWLAAPCSRDERSAARGVTRETTN